MFLQKEPNRGLYCIYTFIPKFIPNYILNISLNLLTNISPNDILYVTVMRKPLIPEQSADMQTQFNLKEETIMAIKIAVANQKGGVG